MDFKAGLSIYNKLWFIEPNAAEQLFDVWEKIKAGDKWDWANFKGEEKVKSTYEIQNKFFAIDGVTMAPASSYDMEQFSGFQGAEIAVIPISGPLMRSDFCGSFGTSTLAQLTKMASETESVTTVVFLFDSPGGVVDGTESFAQTIKDCSKKTIALNTGIMCSAAYWLAASCDEIYASSKTDITGSIGTMCSIKNSDESDKKYGIVKYDYYATASTDKNKLFTDAKNGDGTGLVEEMLNPMNDCFIAAVKEGRGNKISDKALTGKSFVGEKAQEVGLIDGIKSFEKIVKSEQKKPITIFNKNNNYMAEKLSIEEIKAQYPEHVTAIKAEALEAERDRIGAWDAWREIDPAAVQSGIESGKKISTADTQKLTVKATGAKNVAEIVEANAKPVATAAATTEKKDPEAVAAEEAMKDWIESRGTKK